MTLYVENPKNFMKKKKKLLELINPAKLQEYKISTANQLFLYTNNEQSKKEIKKTNSIYNSIKINTTLRNKLHQWGERFIHQKLQNIAEKL